MALLGTTLLSVLFTILAFAVIAAVAWVVAVSHTRYYLPRSPFSQNFEQGGSPIWRCSSICADYPDLDPLLLGRSANIAPKHMAHCHVVRKLTVTFRQYARTLAAKAVGDHVDSHVRHKP